MRMRFLRILPEICASTSCSLLSIRITKKALGCLSTTTPDAGTKSSLDNIHLLCQPELKPRATHARPSSLTNYDPHLPALRGLNERRLPPPRVARANPLP